MNTVFTICDKCGANIHYGNAYVAISKNIEQAEYSELTNKKEIHVIDSELLITFCAKCGNAFHYDKIISLVNKPITQKNDAVDLLDEALKKLASNLTYDLVNFKCIGKTNSSYLLIKKGNDKSDEQPGILIQFDEKYNKIPIIAGKYRHVGSPMAFCAFDWLDDLESHKVTDMMIQYLSCKERSEIEIFFNLEKQELENVNDII